ncbi:hypothetical protein [Fuerstiella marisgermanici]|uniref:Uncharacterized protein n=1 Tax=Fuerstiella marisgermanici TaxID=1891926 RepID=A0A1P8WPA1_9PLAN|nr:hypothetical protein [Fuerstiella marisgermanici]APZ95876.1 hypothetical protein Fuma_05539 [Fuerstiella marisgermanici]
MTEWVIKQILPADGNWFCVWPTAFKDGRYDYEIGRVICFALMGANEKLDHILPVGSDGMPLTDDIAEDVTFFRGSDKAANGRTWTDIWDSLSPARFDRRDLPQEIFD